MKKFFFILLVCFGTVMEPVHAESGLIPQVVDHAKKIAKMIQEGRPEAGIEAAFKSTTKRSATEIYGIILRFGRQYSDQKKRIMEIYGEVESNKEPIFVGSMNIAGILTGCVFLVRHEKMTMPYLLMYELDGDQFHFTGITFGNQLWPVVMQFSEFEGGGEQ